MSSGRFCKSRSQPGEVHARPISRRRLARDAGDAVAKPDARRPFEQVARAPAAQLSGGRDDKDS
jgi:hypothetical protein